MLLDFENELVIASQSKDLLYLASVGDNSRMISYGRLRYEKYYFFGVVAEQLLLYFVGPGYRMVGGGRGGYCRTAVPTAVLQLVVQLVVHDACMYCCSNSLSGCEIHFLLGRGLGSFTHSSGSKKTQTPSYLRFEERNAKGKLRANLRERTAHPPPNPPTTAWSPAAAVELARVLLVQRCRSREAASSLR